MSKGGEGGYYGEDQPLPEESDEESDAGQGGSDGGYGSDGGAVVDMEDMGAMMTKQRDDPNTGGKGGSARNNRRYPGEVAVGGEWRKTEP